MTKPTEPKDDGLVSSTEKKTPAEVRGYWTDERIAAAQPVPMPRPKPPPAGNETGEATSGERTP